MLAKICKNLMVNSIPGSSSESSQGSVLGMAVKTGRQLSMSGYYINHKKGEIGVTALLVAIFHGLW